MSKLDGYISENKVCLNIANLAELNSLIKKASQLHKELGDILFKIEHFYITFEFSETVKHEE